MIIITDIAKACKNTSDLRAEADLIVKTDPAHPLAGRPVALRLMIHVSQ